MFLDPIVKPLESIGLGFVRLGELLVELIKFVIYIPQIAIAIFNPVNILNDSITGIFMGIKILFKGILDALNPRTFFSNGKYNRCKDTGSGLFGMRRPVNSKGKVTDINKSNDRKCVSPTLFRMIMF